MHKTRTPLPQLCDERSIFPSLLLKWWIWVSPLDAYNAVIGTIENLILALWYFLYCPAHTPRGHVPPWKILAWLPLSPAKPRGAYDNKSEKQISSIQYLETFIFNLWIWKKHWYPYKKPSAEKACPSLGRNYQSHDIITMPPLIIEWTLKEIISSVKARPSPIKNSITLIIICTELDNRGDEESRNKFFLLIYL